MRKILIIIIVSIFNYSNVLANCRLADDASRTVGAGGSITEIVYFLNSEDKLVARDLTSNFPPIAKDLPSIGYVRNLSAEGLLSLSPTLVIGESDIGPPNVVKQVQNTSLDFRIIPDIYSAKGIIEKVLCLANILGIDENEVNIKENELNTKFEIISNLSNSKNLRKKKLMIILMMRGTSPIVAGSETSGDGFIKMTGNLNSFSNFAGWKPVGIESIVENNPDYIIITKRAFTPFENEEKFLKQTGLIATNAGKNQNIIVEDGMSFLGFGPRTLDTAIKIGNFLTDN